MKKTVLFLVAFISLNAFGKTDVNSIVEEGKLLYQSEMASWYGTDLFIASYQNQNNIGGYFSYVDNEQSKCIFYSRTENPKVIGTIIFDTTYNVKTAIVDLIERDFTSLEKELYTIRTISSEIIYTDTLFKAYENTRLNLIPLINKNEKKVYILTGPQESGVVIFGNDYVLVFDKNNKLKTKRQLHRNIIPIYYSEEEGKKVETTIHSHLPETGDYITATDICTLMLYEKFAKWKQHNVVSEKYLNVWDCEKNELNIVPMNVIKKINEDNEKRKNANNKK
ncbi:hypothetical protein FACS189434_01960 [Bacteroidia bacterium]|nr:hypothetical protein FACS189434_01960 [Bacteroidia bacterium]